MDFEKHSDPKGTLNIGKIAIPIEVYSLYTNDPGDQKEGGGYGHSNMTDLDSRRILEGISKGELSSGWEDRYYVGQVVKKTYDPKKGNSTTFHVMPLTHCINCYIEFQGKKYFIPKP